MKFLSKSTQMSEVVWFVALSACLLALYLVFFEFGFTDSDSKGLSLLGLFVILAVRVSVYRWRLNSRWDRRFAGLSLEDTMAELEKVTEEWVTAGVVTRAELAVMHERAKSRFDRQQQSGAGSNGTV